MLSVLKFPLLTRVSPCRKGMHIEKKGRNSGSAPFYILFIEQKEMATSKKSAYLDKLEVGGMNFIGARDFSPD